MPNLDIYKRTCTKAAQLWKELDVTQSEVDNEPDQEEVGEEEQAEAETEEEPIDCCKLLAELECMKRRIQKLQLRLKVDDVCDHEPCIDLNLELNCSINPEICTLQKNHHKLQCQINELIRCCNVAKDQIEELRARLCQKSREILALQKAVCQLESWRNTLQHEFGVCYERFQYLKHVKAEWEDVEKKLDEQKRCFKMLEDIFVPKICFLSEKHQFIDEIAELREFLQEMFHLQTSRFNAIEQRMDDIERTVRGSKTQVLLLKQTHGTSQRESEITRKSRDTSNLGNVPLNLEKI